MWCCAPERARCSSIASASTRNIDLERVEAAITPRTRAILPVDLAGLPVNRDRLYEIANAHRLRVIEDAAQSMGANWAGRAIGSSGDLVSISFHANKNITTAEGGCLVLNDEAEARRCELWRLQGVERSGDSWDGMDVTLAGGKHNLTDIAACIGLGQLPALDRVHRAPARTGATLLCAFRSRAGVRTAASLTLLSATGTCFRCCCLKTSSAMRFIAAMRAAGIGVGVHYPAMHLFTLFRKLGYGPGDFPNAERIGRRIVSLPMFPAMQDSDVDRVLAALGPALAAGNSDPSARSAVGSSRQ